MKKLMGLFLLALGICLLSVKAEAAASTRGPKGFVSMQNSTTGVTISSAPAVLYSVMLSTGTAGTDFVVLFDSAAITGLSATYYGTAYRGRINVSSTTQNTYVVFDPPLQFKNGIVAVNSSAPITSLFTFEPGRIISGY